MMAANSAERRIAREGVVLMAAAVVQAGVAFLANLILARHLGPEEFGRFAVVLAGVSLVLSVISLRPNVLIIRTPEAELDQRRRERLFGVIAVETTFAGLLVVIWMAATGTTRGVDFLLAAAVLLGHWLSHDRAFYERGMRFARLAFLETGISVAGHVLSVALVLAGLGGLALYLRELFFAIAGLVGLALVGAVSLYRLRMPDRDEWAATLRDARGVWLDAALDSSFQRMIVLVANASAGLVATGLFFQAHRLAQVPLQFLSPLLARVAGVWFSRTEDAGQRHRMRWRLGCWIAPPLVAAAAGAWFFADPVVPWLFGSHWAPAAPVLAALGGMIVFQPLFEMLRVYALSSRRARLLLAARLGQYGVFGVVVLVCFPLDNQDLAVALSLSCLAAFAALAAALLWHERREAS